MPSYKKKKEKYKKIHQRIQDIKHQPEELLQLQDK